MDSEADRLLELARARARYQADWLEAICEDVKRYVDEAPARVLGEISTSKKGYGYE